KITESAVTGAPVIALCGKVWVPGRDPNKFPVCPTCKEIYEGLREPQDGGDGERGEVQQDPRVERAVGEREGRRREHR
ncbi:DUF3039 domain-containing protein, partial [Streptococcus anginosus]|nr:DUF3039 domain-containing protein [Streptococcus anginosus]